MIELFNESLPILTVIAQVASVALLLLLIFVRSKENPLTSFISDNAMLFAFIVALVATLGSLFYSEVLEYEPCKLCWYQRILMYPQTILLGMALIKKDIYMYSYSIVLSVIGAAIAGFHYYGQRFNNGLLSCDTLGQSVSCSTQFILDFGYITIPLMAFSGFILIILLMICQKVYNKNS